ncbi:MAG: ABC transporter permease [Proteobacteria bacterium]|nr:ABC transporter permease [Pseudomonadota bacterium]
MGDLSIAWRQISARWITHGLTIVAIGLALALAVATTLLSRGVQAGIDRAAGPFGLLVGAKGSAQQLVLSTVLLQGAPVGNVARATLDRIAKHPGVASAIPLALGDSYRRLRIIGTTSDFLETRTRPAAPTYFRITQGRVFAKPFEAVLGSAVALRTGFKLGDTFRADHGDEPELPGEEEDDAHGSHPYTVVGILAGTRSPADLGIYVAIESYWELHADQRLTPGDPTGRDAVTAILIVPRAFPADVYRIQQQALAGVFGPDVQAVVPYQELAALNRQVSQAQTVLSAVAVGAMVIAATTIFLAMYGSVSDRRRDLAILRALGASRQRILAIVLVECLVVSVLGAIFGVAGGATLGARSDVAGQLAPI